MWAGLISFVLIGTGLRLIDLTDEPLDYHPMRQLRGALIAREIYYRVQPDADPAMQERAAVLTSVLEPQEPPILESLVALGYLVSGSETLWLARLLTGLFWLAGGYLVYRLAAEWTDEVGALASLAYYLILPLGVYASRSFQPDSLMVMLLLTAALALYRWAERDSWLLTLAAGITAGLAILVKGRIAPIAFVLIAAAAIEAKGLRGAMRDGKSWVMAGLASMIPFSYYFLVIGPDSIAWIRSTSGGFLWIALQPWFYVRWLNFLDGLVYFGFLLLAAWGTLMMDRPARTILLGLWAGFLLYGVSLPYTMYTHDYYNLMLVPTIALGISPLAAHVASVLKGRSWIWRSLALAVAGLAVLYPAWTVRSALLSKDYRQEPFGWAKMGRELPETGEIIGITHEYGYRLAYYGWRQAFVWPSQADLASYELQGHSIEGDISADFQRRTANMDYFLVTDFSEFDSQPALKQLLNEHYPVLLDGEGYLLYDLRNPR